MISALVASDRREPWLHPMPEVISALVSDQAEACRLHPMPEVISALASDQAEAVERPEDVRNKSRVYRIGPRQAGLRSRPN